VNVWEGVGAFDEARAFCELWGVAGTVLVDERGELVDRLGIRGVPTNVLVDADGTIRCIGATTPWDLEAAVRELLGPDAAFEEPGSSGGWHWQKDSGHIEEQLESRVNRRRGD
jgi:hypothetical protein